MSKNALLNLLSPAKTHSAPVFAAGTRKDAILPIMRGPLDLATMAARPRLQFVASTGNVDRYGEVIEPSGWVLENFLKNPVFQNAHRYRDVADTLGRVVECGVREVVLRGGDSPKPALVIDVDFAVEANPVAKLAYDLYAGGYLNAVSVGFIPLEWRDMEGKDGIYRVYQKQELLEVSAVGVPANPDCLVLNRA